MALGCFCLQVSARAEVYGPANLLKTVPTPFTTGPANEEQQAGGAGEIAPLSLSGSQPSRAGLGSRLGLSDRLVAPRLYLPGRMTLGKSAEFVFKGKPGKWVALAMADRNSGARDIFGHKIRLGPDRKLVSLARIPESGIVALYVETPIQGDLVGQNLYFEAATWNASDFSDLEIAQTVASEQPEPTVNGVVVSAETTVKRGLRFVPDSTAPPSQRQFKTLDSGNP